VDEIRVEDQETYKRKVGKWRRSAWNVLAQGEKFFLAVAFAKKSRGRLDRLLYTVQKKRRDEPQALARLVWGKCQTISKGIEKLLGEDMWAAFIDAAEVLSKSKSRAKSNPSVPAAAAAVGETGGEPVAPSSETAAAASSETAGSGRVQDSRRRALEEEAAPPTEGGGDESGAENRGVKRRRISQDAPGGTQPVNPTTEVAAQERLRDFDARLSSLMAGEQQESHLGSRPAGPGEPPGENAHVDGQQEDEEEDVQHVTQSTWYSKRLWYHMQRLLKRMLANFERRITQRCTSAPAHLLWLGAATPDQAVSQRAELAAELLSARESPGAYPAARAIAQRFPAALEACVKSGGRVDPRLWCLFRMIGWEWKADTQELESLMSSIRLVVAACPSIRQPGLDARLGLMKAFRELVGDAIRSNLRWSRDAKPAIENMIDELVDANWQSVMHRLERWTVPPPCLRNVSTGAWSKYRPVLATSTPLAFKWATK
jgi:hypothetical protein